MPLKLELEDDGGKKFVREFQLSIDFNAASYIEAKSGFGFIDGEIWANLNAATISIMLYAAVLAKHPEYWTEDRDGKPTDEGLEIIRSYMGMENSEAIVKALNDAYVAQLPADKRERALKRQAEAEARAAAGDTTANPTPPAVETTAGIATAAG
jgi:hypothetical protein